MPGWYGPFAREDATVVGFVPTGEARQAAGSPIVADARGGNVEGNMASDEMGD